MEATAHLQAQGLDCFGDSGGAAHRPRWPVERRKKSVPEALDLAPSKYRELLPYRVVMLVEQALPFPVPEFRRPLSRLDDVGEQDGRKHPVCLDLPARPRQEFLHLIDKVIGITD